MKSLGVTEVIDYTKQDFTKVNKTFDFTFLKSAKMHMKFTINMNKTSSIYKCPVCMSMLSKAGNQYTCKNNHSFDIAKEGYVNLLYPAKSNTEQGDNKEMILARHKFLNSGYYSKLSDELNKTVSNLSKCKPITILDSGCGEGYYIKNLYDNAMNKNSQMSFYGIDISKSAIKIAAKKNKEINFSVANVFKLPILENSIDIAFSVFSPCNEDEIYRILKDQSFWIVVTPGKYHLFELKHKLYENVELNDDPVRLNLLKMIDKTELKYAIDINSKEDIHDLIKMTPYYYKTSREKIESLVNATSNLLCRLEFGITIYQATK